MSSPSDYPPDTWDSERNHYGQPIVRAEFWRGEHFAAIVPTAAGLPPVCACGWTRHRGFELSDHLADMAVTS